MGESSIGESPREEKLCLVCGRLGGKTVVVTSGHSFVKTSGTALSKFIYEVVGEDPCYSMSEVVCEQCYNLLDRLDTYKAHAAQIQSHITTRYKDTKLELLGQRQRLSELISNTLDNVKQIQNGTTLNVSNELTITVMHETLPDQQNLATSRSFGEVFPSNESSLSLNERAFPNLVLGLKKHKLLDSSKKSVENARPKKSKRFTNKKKNLSNYFRGLGKEQIPPTKLDYSTTIKSLSSLMEITQDEVQQNKKKTVADEVLIYRQSDLTATPRSLTFKRHRRSSGSEYSHSSSDSEGTREIKFPKYHLPSSQPTNSYKTYTDTPKSYFKSTPELTIQKSKLEIKSVRPKKSKKSSKRETTIVKQTKETPDLATIEYKKIKEEDLTEYSELTQPEELLEVCPNAEVSVEQVPQEDYKLEKDDAQIDDKSSVEAALMDNPLASSLLQSFLSTSLWFTPLEQTDNKGDSSNIDQEAVPSDDVTRESLVVAAGTVKDKKKRQELKNTGQCYVNTKGKLVEAKRVQPQDCSRCPLKCNSRISEADRLSIFAEYWGLADYNLQREYLAVHMERDEKLGPSGLVRTVVLYFITHNNKRMQVCRQFFLKTLDVSEKASRIVLEKKLRGELGTEKKPVKNKTVFLNMRDHSSDVDENEIT